LSSDVKSYSYALVTPSFSLDAERCRLLLESVDRWVAPGVRHYLVVDRRDLSLFNSMRSARTEVLVVEDITPRWLIRLPGIRRFWLSLRSPPVRNWIMQQVIKLSIPTMVPEDVLLYTDSDVFFVGPYDPRAFERDGKLPLFVERGQRGLIKNNDAWHRVAAELLGLEPQQSYDTGYIGNVIPWRRDIAVALLQRIAAVADKPWQLAVTRRLVFAEYILYGMFSQDVLGASAGLWEDGTLRTLCYWPPIPLDFAGLEKLKSALSPQHHSVMISAKSRTPVADIRSVFLA
jgi:hypothetical protein